jgi:hypothetical protein
MGCDAVRSFFSQIATKSISTQIDQASLNFFSTNGYVLVMRQDEYAAAEAEIASLEEMGGELQTEEAQEGMAQAKLEEEEKKTHSIFFRLEGEGKKEAEKEAVETEVGTVSKEQAEIADRESKISELIRKKSVVDRMVPYGGQYLALTGLGVMTLNDLTIRNYRVADTDFAEFVEESKATSDELRGIAQRGGLYLADLKNALPDIGISEKDFDDQTLSLLWSVSIGLAKLQGEQTRISQRYLVACDVLKDFKSTVENKMMAAEVLTASAVEDLPSLSQTLVGLEKELRRDKVPKQLSTGIAAVIMFGRRFDGSFPTDRFVEFCRLTSSYESAAILSVLNVPTDQLSDKFKAFKSQFDSWGYKTSEDTELASAYLAIGELGPDDVRTKMTIVLDALKNYLEYPLVASAVLTSIPTLEAYETLDLMEKASSMLGSVASGLQRSELVTLAVRMIHGIQNELLKKLDPTATVANTPVQFTYSPSNLFIAYHPFIVVHSAYFATYSGIGGYHPAHVHGFWG